MFIGRMAAGPNVHGGALWRADKGLKVRPDHPRGSPLPSRVDGEPLGARVPIALAEFFLRMHET